MNLSTHVINIESFSSGNNPQKSLIQYYQTLPEKEKEVFTIALIGAYVATKQINESMTPQITIMKKLLENH